jgi:HK97 family phage portal protein
MRSLIGKVLDKAPISYVPRTGSPLFASTTLRNDAEQQMLAMGSVGTLFAIVSRTANAVSQVDWKLYRKAKSGKKEDRQEVTTHAALDTWNKPNGFYTRQELVESVQQHVELTGEGWLIVGRNPRLNIPLELWPVRPDRMAPVTSPTEFIAGYTYAGPNGETIPFDRADVLMQRMPNPLDPYRGMGPVQSILTDLDSTKYSAEWNRNFFLNSAEPGGIIEIDRRLGDDEFDEMSTRWREQHQGVSRAHRVAIIEQGKWVDRKYTMRDMQFTELRNVSREIIREAFGFPKPMLGGVDDVNRANAEAGEVVFARWLVVPRLERWKQMLNAEFLPQFGPTGDGLEFDYDSPVPEDAEAADRARASKATAAKTYIDAGFTAVSVVEALDLPATLKWEKPDPPVIAAPVAPGANANGGKSAAPATSNRVSRVTRFTRPGRPGQPANLADMAASIDLTPVQDDWQEALDAVSSGWRNEVTPAQQRQLSDAIAQIVDHGPVGNLAHLTVDTAGGAALLALVMAELAHEAGKRVVYEASAQAVDISPAIFTAATMRPIADATAGLLGSGYANAAGREALRLYLPGASGADIAAATVTHLDDLSDVFLRDALGGALTRAQNLGRLATLRNAPAAAYFAAEDLDQNTCQPCRNIDGTRLPTLDAANLAYGGGPYLFCKGGLRCRGTVIAVWGGTE